MALFCAFWRSYPLVNQLLSKSCSARQIPDGTKTGQNHRKIKSRTLCVLKPLLRILLFIAKVRFCPMTTKLFFGKVLSYKEFCCHLVFAEDTASGSTSVPCFALQTPVKTCFTPSGHYGGLPYSSRIAQMHRRFATCTIAQRCVPEIHSHRMPCVTLPCQSDGRPCGIHTKTAVIQLLK